MSCRSHPLLTPGGGCGARKYVNNDTGLLTVTRGRDILLIFYVGSLTVIMSIIPWNNINPEESPFVRLFALIGIPFAAGIINFVVLPAAASSCNSGIFSNSRMLFGLSNQQQAPPIFEKTNKNGVPHIAILVSCALLLSSHQFRHLTMYTLKGAILRHV